MIDYEAIADSVHIPTPDPAPAGPPAFDASTVFIDGEPTSDPEVLQAATNRVYLPLNHDKYQGIAAAKGYKQGEDFSGSRLQRVRYSHEAMIDVILAEPTIKQSELAKRFGHSENWISIVMGSDAFQAALAKRRDDIVDPFLIATVEERLRGLATQSLTVIAENLEKTRSADLAIKALDISTKALGFGARNPNANAVQNNFVIQLPPKIASSSEWAQAHSPGAAGPIIDGDAA